MGYLISLIFQVLLSVPALRACVVTVVPSFLLLRYVRKKDRLEPEPPKLIWSLFGLGAASGVLAFVLELAGFSLLALIGPGSGPIALFLHWYVIVGLGEEFSKYGSLRLYTWRSREFNCLYDGMVYAAAVAAGFALLENIAYLLRYGGSVMFLRAVVSVPGHVCFGVLMGAWYGAAKKHDIMEARGRSKRCRALAVLVPGLVHGLFDHLAVSVSSVTGLWPFFLLVGVMFIVCRLMLKRLSDRDAYFTGREPDGGESA